MSQLLEWAGVLTGPVGLLAGAWLQKRFSRKVDEAAAHKSDNDAAQAIAAAAVALVAPLEARVTKLEQQHSLAIAYIRDLWAWIDRHMPGRKPLAPPEALNLT